MIGRKYFACFLGLLLFFLLPIFFSFSAQSAEVFEIELYTRIQDPDTHIFEIVALVKSEKDNDRVSISWNLPKGLELRDEKKEEQHDVVVQRGDNEYILEVIPITKINDFVTFTIESYESTKRILTIQKGTIHVDNDLVLLPITQEYNTLKFYYAIQSMAWTICLIFFGLSLFGFVMSKILSIIHPEKPQIKTEQNSKILKEIEKKRLEIPSSTVSI